MTNQLTPFEGKEVLSVGIEIRNAAGGLNQALAVDPQEWHHDDEVTVVLRCKLDKLRFDKVKDTDGFKRIHSMLALSATVIDDELVAKQLDEQAQRIEEASGIKRLPFDEADPVEAHNAGEHTELVDDCPECEAERQAVADEAAGATPLKGKRGR